MRRCPKCGGKGFNERLCPVCGGLGVIKTPANEAGAGLPKVEATPIAQPETDRPGAIVEVLP